MTDPRRKRSIKSPSGPRKKEAPDPSQFKMNPPPMGRSEVPKPAPRPDPSTASKTARRQGGQAGPRNNQNGRPNQRGGRGPAQGRREQPRRERPEELKGEEWARVIEHDVKSGVVTAFTEKGLKYCRLSVKSNELLVINHRLYIGTDNSQRGEVKSILGMAHLDKMSNMARQDLPVAVQRFVEEHGQYFVDEFYNKAGPMSLKQHSYELLPDVGPVKARNMVKAREQVGMFASMDELNSLAKINGAELLALRFVEELEDRTLAPRLTELLFPVKA
jgi:putative nucleotide binding protein